MTKFKAYPLEIIFCENSTYTAPLRIRVLKEALIINKCSICNLDGYWNDKPITLQLDHINGIGNDNRLENLRFLCPNCHSQTNTFSGRNVKIKPGLAYNSPYKPPQQYNPNISFRQKKNKIWNIPIDKLRVVINNSCSFSEALKKLGFSLKGAQYKAIKERLFWEKIDFSHISLGQGHNKGKKFIRPSIDLSLILVKNASYPRYLLKKRVLQEKLLDEICAICGSGPKWNNNVLTLQLDHINGHNSDNRIENLRILCPNCHSQTDTYGGKNNV